MHCSSGSTLVPSQPAAQPRKRSRYAAINSHARPAKKVKAEGKVPDSTAGRRKSKRCGGIDDDVDDVDDYSCDVCNEVKLPDLLLCDACNKGFHTYCLTPPMATKPKGKWLCHGCATSPAKTRTAGGLAASPAVKTRRSAGKTGAIPPTAAPAAGAAPSPRSSRRAARKSLSRTPDKSPSSPAMPSSTTKLARSPSPVALGSLEKPATPDPAPMEPKSIRRPLTPVTPFSANRKEGHPVSALKGSPAALSPPPQPSAGQDAAHGAPQWFDVLDSGKVQQVREVLQTATATAAESPLRRGEQFAELCAEVQCHMTDGTGAALYVSGLPGTGKSFTANLVMRECDRWARGNGIKRPSTVWINCMSLGRPRHIFQRLLEGFKSAQTRGAKLGQDPITVPETSGSYTGNELNALRKLICADAGGKSGKRGMTIAVLDEIDSLVTADQGVLSDLFMLTAAPGSRLILLGISNSIDLTERTLPHLSRLGIQVGLTPFTAYSAESLHELLQQRLSRVPGPVFHPAALQFAARKIGANSGDMRQLLQVARTALDNAEQDARSKAKAAEAAGSAAPLISIGGMAAAVRQLQGSCGLEGAVGAIRQLSREQQTVLCSAATLLGSLGKGPDGGGKRAAACAAAPGKTLLGKYRQAKPGVGPGRQAAGGAGGRRDCTLSELHAAYLALCARVQVPAVNVADFNSVCSNLSDQALIRLGPHKVERSRRVTLQVCEDDIAVALQDVSLFRRMLEGY
eukprot:jgi/Tetstr1/459905/TSEL_005247.t1